MLVPTRAIEEAVDEASTKEETASIPKKVKETSRQLGGSDEEKEQLNFCHKGHTVARIL